MKRTLSLALTLAISLPALAQPAKTKKPERMFPYELQTSKLANGLTVVRVPFKSPGLIAYYSVVRVGSRNEVEPNHTGFAHFFEHMMFKGTPTHPEGEREKILAKGGFDDNAYTTDDFTVYHSYGPSSMLEQLVAIEADRFSNLAYAEGPFQTEAKAVLGEYHKSAARPELKLEEALLATAFKKHPYQHTTLGFYEDIQKMPGYYEYSKQFFLRWYTPDNVVLVVAGDFDDAKLMAAIEKSYGGWKGKSADVKIPSEPGQSELRATRLPWEGAALPRQLIAWPTPAAKLETKDAAIQELLSSYLVGPTSELHQELVLEKQLVEEVQSWYFPHRDPNLFTLDATIKEEKNRAQVIASLNKAIKDLVTGRVDAKKVEDIKANARYEILMHLESANDVAGQLARFIGVYGTAEALERHLQNIARVKPQDLVQFARDNFAARNRNEVSLTVVPAKEGAK